MSGNLGTILVVVISVVAAIGLLALAAIIWVMWRYQVPPRGVVAMFAAFLYLISPVDVLPEAILGPFGLVDDAGVVGATVFFVYRLVKAREMLAKQGVEFPRRRPPSGGQPPYGQPPYGQPPTPRPPSGPDR